jgi:hypothetical protein
VCYKVIYKLLYFLYLVKVRCSYVFSNTKRSKIKRKRKRK